MAVYSMHTLIICNKILSEVQYNDVIRFMVHLAPVCLAGETMRIASSEFADDPCSSVKRGTMVRAARALLSAVTRLLILADMADVMRLLSHLKIVSVSGTLF